MQCYDEGALRAYLDDALPAVERAAIDTHLPSCADCRARLAQQRALAAQVSRLLAAPVDLPDPRLALARLRVSTTASLSMTQGGHRPPPTEDFRNMQHPTRRPTMRTSAPAWFGARRGLFVGLAAIVMFFSLLALPPVRAAANQLLQMFRVQKVVFVPISPERIEQLKNLNFDGRTLFVEQPKLVNAPSKPHTVAAVANASGAVGFPIAQPTAFPSNPTSQEYIVHDRMVMQFKVNVTAARELLGLLNINDVQLPDSLGKQPIVADAPAYVEANYSGQSYKLSLYQGRSPTVTVPDGVDIAQLGTAGLRLLGLDEAQAKAMSKQIDWSSTLIFPFPKNVRDIRTVQIGAAQGLLVGEGRGANAHWQLYWQSGDRFLMLESQGNLTDAEIITAATSVR